MLQIPVLIEKLEFAKIGQSFIGDWLQISAWCILVNINHYGCTFIDVF